MYQCGFTRAKLEAALSHETTSQLHMNWRTDLHAILSQMMSNTNHCVMAFPEFLHVPSATQVQETASCRGAHTYTTWLTVRAIVARALGDKAAQHSELVHRVLGTNDTASRILVEANQPRLQALAALQGTSVKSYRLALREKRVYVRTMQPVSLTELTLRAQIMASLHLSRQPESVCSSSQRQPFADTRERKDEDPEVSRRRIQVMTIQDRFSLAHLDAEHPSLDMLPLLAKPDAWRPVWLSLLGWTWLSNDPYSHSALSRLTRQVFVVSVLVSSQGASLDWTTAGTNPLSTGAPSALSAFRGRTPLPVSQAHQYGFLAFWFQLYSSWIRVSPPQLTRGLRALSPLFASRLRRLELSDPPCDNLVVPSNLLTWLGSTLVPTLEHLDLCGLAICPTTQWDQILPSVSASQSLRTLVLEVDQDVMHVIRPLASLFRSPRFDGLTLLLGPKEEGAEQNKTDRHHLTRDFLKFLSHCIQVSPNKSTSLSVQLVVTCPSLKPNMFPLDVCRAWTDVSWGSFSAPVTLSLMESKRVLPQTEFRTMPTGVRVSEAAYNWATGLGVIAAPVVVSSSKTLPWTQLVTRVDAIPDIKQSSK